MAGKAHKDPGKYTRPRLRQRLKAEIQRSDRGGRAGQWSARKSQLLVQAYERAGGGYRGGKSRSQKDLERWTAEDWQTRGGGARARHGGTTERYLPREAWERLSPAERRRTDRRKRRASREGRQFVPNTRRAKEARRDVSLGHGTVRELHERARALDVPGRSRMNKAELVRAIREAR